MWGALIDVGRHLCGKAATLALSGGGTIGGARGGGDDGVDHERSVFAGDSKCLGASIIATGGGGDVIAGFVDGVVGGALCGGVGGKLTVAAGVGIGMYSGSLGGSSFNLYRGLQWCPYPLPYLDC